MLVSGCGPAPSGPTDGATASLGPGPSASQLPNGTESAAATASPLATPFVLHAGCPATTANNSASSHQRSEVNATSNWSGYVVRSSRSFSCIQGSWTQPTVTCPTSGVASLAIWVGLDGESGPSLATLEQIGTAVDCRDGRADLFAWFEILPRDRFERQLKLEIRSGDRISASIAVVGRAYHMVVENLTTGIAEDTTERSPGARRLTAEWVVEAPTVDCPNNCRVAPLPSFGTVSFSAARAIVAGVSGPIGDGRWTRVRLDLESRSGVLRARPGTLARGGSGFTVTWRHR